MKLSEAIAALEQGKKVKLQRWGKSSYIVRNNNHICDHQGEVRDAYFSDEWELYEEPQSLTHDQICKALTQRCSWLEERMKKIEDELACLKNIPVHIRKGVDIESIPNHIGKIEFIEDETQGRPWAMEREKVKALSKDITQVFLTLDALENSSNDRISQLENKVLSSMFGMESINTRIEMNRSLYMVLEDRVKELENESK